MSDEFEDVTEWIEKTSSRSSTENSGKQRPSHLNWEDEDEVDSQKIGDYTQFAFYKNGFAPTTATVPTIPAGTYDVQADSNGVYIVRTPEPSGLLLELPEMRSDVVVKYTESFWNSEKDYKEGNEFVVGGANFKSGIMIYGPPGSGKSCTIKIVCKKLVEKGGVVFFASVHPSVVNDWLIKFRGIEPNRKCIVILEDIDSLIEQNGEFSYLEMLDSAKTIDNVMFIATTNYPERLDPRIYNRPGRFSNVVKIGMPTRAAREAYLKTVLKNHKDLDQILDGSDGFSVDHLSALVNSVYREKKDLTKELERLRKLFNIPKLGDSKKLGIKIGKGDDEEDSV